MSVYPHDARERMSLLLSFEGKTLDEQIALLLPYELKVEHQMEMARLLSTEERKKQSRVPYSAAKRKHHRVRQGVSRCSRSFSLRAVCGTLLGPWNRSV